MSTPPPPNLFREKALEKAASPERLDQDIQIIKPYSWLPLAAIIRCISS
jgi:HlyD family secretion protein